MQNKHPDIEEMRALLDYNPETGDLTWLPRCEAFFKKRSDFLGWNKRYSGKLAGCLDRQGYLRLKLFGKMVAAHRIAWALTYNKWPDGEIDHINLIKDDNRIVNLRDVSRRENQRNTLMQSNNTSGHKGIYWNRRASKWEASLYGKYVGIYESIEEAINARQDALKIMFSSQSDKSVLK
jgi:hypothetical protein